ncbi:MAG: hypothetical protein Q8S73_38820 [Deltaproteobacteria bacterium]|nr:hypothetical protein [Myxococcales bacterium]MDP3220119.1 hypothetical protein [Deltaproteobacteria bacterium]
MRSWRGWLLGALVGSLGACGSTSLLLDPQEAGADAATASADSAPPLPDAVPTTDAATPDLGVDAPKPSDATLLPGDLPAPSEDLPPPLDTPAPVDAPAPVDTSLPSELPPTPDVPLPADAPADAPAPVDAPPACPTGLTDRCPAAFPGECADLADGAPHTLTFEGLTAGLPASCEGAMTSAGPDGVAPLTITTPSDVVLVARPTGGDTAVLTLSTAAGCGQRAGELRCHNSSASGSGGVATLRASTLGPGTYAVTVSTIAGRPAVVQATITPARPRPRGDVCPGVVVTPDGAAVTLSTAGFAGEADHGTACGSNGAGGWVDAVFSYTLTAARDVTISVSPTGSGDVAVSVHTRCGERGASLPGCVTGSPARRILRNQAPGTYYVVVEHRSAGAAGRALVTAVTTAAPTLPGPADTCPGVPLTPGVAARVDVAGLTAGSAALSCLGSARADAVFGFTAPGMSSDVLLNVAGSDGARVGYTLQSPCGGAAVGGCTGPGGSVWRRYQGLTGAQAYSVVAGTEGMLGSVTAQYLLVPAATSVSVSGNESCGARRSIPATGGVFRGNSASAPPPLAAPPCGGLGCAGGRAVYYQLTLTERRRVIANTLGSGFDTILSINGGDSCPGRPVSNGCNDDTVAQASQVDVTLAAGTYFVVVQGCGLGRGGDYTLDVAVVAP